jgi:hypothetical protein
MRVAVPLVLLLALVAACGGSEPDRVVGVVLKCERPASVSSVSKGFNSRTPAAAVVIPAAELTGEDCNAKVPNAPAANTYSYSNVRLVVTVKPGNGNAYTVEVPPETAVSVGDKWPPN